MPWTVVGGTGYLMVPDLTVLAADWRRVGDGIDPPPLLVVEIASSSTRRADRGRKLADYRLGGAGMYLLVDLPATFEAHHFATGRVVKAEGEIELVIGGHPGSLCSPAPRRDRSAGRLREMFIPAFTGYTVDDLDWLRDELNVYALLELDPWGSLVVSPIGDDHVLATAELGRQAILQLSHTVSVNGFVWSVPGGTGYVMKPDLLILDRGWQRVDELHFDPPPLLVVEIASPSTRRADRTRKLADYRLGGAEKYLLVDLPDAFELHDFVAGTVVKAIGAIELVVGGQPVKFSLPA